MPSRRAALRALAAGVAALGGCARIGGPATSTRESTRTSTTAATHTTPETPTATTREPTETTTSTETTEEPPETTGGPTEARCDEQWEPTVRWSVPTDVRAYAPTVAEGTVYFGSQDGFLYAVDAATGEVAWRVRHDGRLGSPGPAVHDGIVTYAGYLRLTAFDAADGAERWSFTAPGSLANLARFVADDGDAVYVGASQHPGPNQALEEGETEYDRVYAFDRRTGDRRWRISIPDSFGGDWAEAVAAADGRVFVIVDGGPLLALDAADGSTLWRVDSEFDHYSVVAGDAVYQVAGHGLVALDAATGDERWSATGEWPPAVTADAVYTAAGDVLRALDAADGSTLWRAELPVDGASRAPAVADDTVYIPVRTEDADGRLYAFDATTGCRRGSFEVNSRGSTTPAVTEDAVYVGGSNGEGRLWAVSTP